MKLGMHRLWSRLFRNQRGEGGPLTTTLLIAAGVGMVGMTYKPSYECARTGARVLQKQVGILCRDQSCGSTNAGESAPQPTLDIGPRPASSRPLEP